jgi:protease-4
VFQRKGVGLVLFLIALAIVFSIGGMLILILAAGGEPQVSRNSTLVLRLDRALAESEPRGIFDQFFEAPPTVRSVVDSLRKAKVDPRIAAVVVAPTAPQALWAKVQEVRDAILDFKQSDKPIVGYMEYGGEQEFYLASACDQVYLMPVSSLDLTGMATYELFFRGTLDKIGAHPDLLHIGDYKTAANTFTERTYTPAHREMAESLNRDLYGQLVAGLAQARRKSDEEMRALIDHGPFVAADALAAGLVDGLAYEDEIAAKAGLGDGDRRVDLRTYRRVSAESAGLGGGPRLAVIYVDGTITSGASAADSPSGPIAGSDTIGRYLRRARDDRSIRAIVLRVDSPGGSAIASDVIWRDVQLARASKPVVASMSDVAASGGYYVAMPAHAIVAEPGTLTGSIGVVMGKFALGGTLDKLGLGMDAVSEGRYALLQSPVRPFSPEERAKIEELMQATYDAFVRKAADARQKTVAEIDAVARGRVWTGQQAKAIGLVDELGGLTRAIALAKARAGIDAAAEVQLVIYPPRRGILEALADPFGDTARSRQAAWLPDGWERRALGALTAPLTLFRRGEPLALMPNVFLR